MVYPSEFLCLSLASCSSRKRQIKSGLSSDTPWETSSICMIYLLRQMKSLSAYSCEKGFNVSSLGANAICIKFDFVKTFFLLPPIAHGNVLKCVLVAVFHTGRQKVGIHWHYHCTVKEQYIVLYCYPYLVWRRQMGRQVNKTSYIMKIEL